MLKLAKNTEVVTSVAYLTQLVGATVCGLMRR